MLPGSSKTHQKRNTNHKECHCRRLWNRCRHSGNVELLIYCGIVVTIVDVRILESDLDNIHTGNSPEHFTRGIRQF